MRALRVRVLPSLPDAGMRSSRSGGTARLSAVGVKTEHPFVVALIPKTGSVGGSNCPIWCPCALPRQSGGGCGRRRLSGGVRQRVGVCPGLWDVVLLRDVMCTSPV